MRLISGVSELGKSYGNLSIRTEYAMFKGCAEKDGMRYPFFSTYYIPSFPYRLLTLKPIIAHILTLSPDGNAEIFRIAE